MEGKNIAVADVRFQNEADMIKSFGGIVVKIVCPSAPVDEDERYIDDVSYDFVIVNDDWRVYHDRVSLFMEKFMI